MEVLFFSSPPTTHTQKDRRKRKDIYVSQLETGNQANVLENVFQLPTLYFVYKWIHPMLIHDENSKALGKEENCFNLVKRLYILKKKKVQLTSHLLVKQ